MKLTYENLAAAVDSYVDRTGRAPMLRLAPGVRETFFLLERKAGRAQPQAPAAVTVGPHTLTIVADPACPPGLWYLVGRDFNATHPPEDTDGLPAQE